MFFHACLYRSGVADVIRHRGGGHFPWAPLFGGRHIARCRVEGEDESWRIYRGIVDVDDLERLRRDLLRCNDVIHDIHESKYPQYNKNQESVFVISASGFTVISDALCRFDRVQFLHWNHQPSPREVEARSRSRRFLGRVVFSVTLQWLTTEENRGNHTKKWTFCRGWATKRPGKSNIFQKGSISIGIIRGWNPLSVSP